MKYEHNRRNRGTINRGHGFKMGTQPGVDADRIAPLRLIQRRTIVSDSLTMLKSLLIAPVCVALVPVLAAAQTPSDAQVRFFETNIRPALVKYCYECHSVEAGDSRAGLLVDSREGLLQGGDSGPAIEPGSAESSLFWEAITWEGIEMPPSERMPAPVIAKFKQWIDMGAPDPRERKALEFNTKITPKDIAKGKREHWSFQPPKRKSGATIDSLVDAKLAEEGLKPSQAADGYTLLRRLYFDLTGLPPTPAEILAFQPKFESNPDAAIKAKVNELLSRPQFGERWGRHWLDVARYAESSGSRNVSYPHAWRYRDYVIDSFNDDTPYDRFIAEQIAGDLLPVKSDQQWQENLIATGFLAIGLKHHDEKNPRKFMADMVDEQIDTTTQAVLGLTVACARCHDHKYDPIPTDDYYSLAGIFYSTQTYYGTDRVGQNHRPSDLLLLPVADKTPIGQSSSRQSMAEMKARVAALDQEMAGMRGKERRELRNVRNRIAGQLARLNSDGTAKSFAMGVQEADQMVNANILLGGEVDLPAQEVPRGFVQLLGNLNFTSTGNRSSGRLELVKAMTSKNNPLTARVMANRVWMHLLGKPLVETASNFGVSGSQPSNQELLDHLAIRFMDHDWSVKQLIREIVISDTYRRSATYDAGNYAVDPDNRYWWRANPRQVDAEALRDSMLAMSGRLNRNRPLASPTATGGGRGGSVIQDENNPHRSVYLPIVRDQLPASLELFDFPDPNLTSPGRSDSIVPTQALYLMNDRFVMSQAAGLAATLEQRFEDTGDQVRMAFLWAYGRPATRDELNASAEFFKTYPVTGTTAKPAGPSNVERGRGRPGRRSQVGSSANRRPGRRGGANGGPDRTSSNAAPSRNADASPNALSVFCQTLMASARFRILN